MRDSCSSVWKINNYDFEIMMIDQSIMIQSIMTLKHLNGTLCNKWDIFYFICIKAFTHVDIFTTTKSKRVTLSHIKN